VNAAVSDDPFPQEINVTKKLHGILPALATPLTDDGQVNVAALGELVDWLIDSGVHGLVPLGSTGEFYALSPAERETVLRTTLEAASGRVPVVAGANAGSTADVIHFSRQAEELGADGVLLAPPYYSLPESEELVAHFQDVAAAISIPITLYNYPGRAGVDITPDLVERLAAIDNISYIKESTGDMTRVSEIIRRCGDAITVLCGCDTLALESFVMGAAGWIGGVANVAPRQHVRLYELAVEQGDIPAAREVDFALLPLLALLESGKYTQQVKAGCKLAGQNVGPPRPPLRPLTDAEQANLAEVLNELLG
jgi:4-hydroxy-tetrahydrodipicolinate synthase